jgi:hypothetical protein
MQIIIETKDKKTKAILPRFQKEQQKAFLDLVKVLKQQKREFTINYK